MSLLYYRGGPGRIPKMGASIGALGGVEMYASTLLSCRTSGRPPKREGARPPLFSTHRSRLARLRPDGVSRSRAASPRIPRIDPRNRPSQHLVTGRGRAGILGQFEGTKSQRLATDPRHECGQRLHHGGTKRRIANPRQGVGTGPRESLLTRTSENPPSRDCLETTDRLHFVIPRARGTG